MATHPWRLVRTSERKHDLCSSSCRRCSSRLPRNPSSGPSMRLRLFFALLLLCSLAPARAAEQSVDSDRDRQVQEGVPQGKITAGTFTESRIYPGTHRGYSVYVPAQYTAQEPASLMVFMDGKSYAKLDGAFRVPTVLDNLIHQRAIPVSVAVFVDPGVIPAPMPNGQGRSNRSFEYDSMGDRYATFLVEEFLPVALKGLNISNDPKRRAVGGISSGGICAFTVAWERPDQFGRVLSHIGSFTNIRGGWAYPGLIRKTRDNPKPIRVYLQEGKDDLNNLFGDWPLANQDMAAALRFAGYDHKLVMTEGGHSGVAGGERLPQALRWLWSDASEKLPPAEAEKPPAWEPHPDAVPRDDVPHGTVHEMPPWESEILANTIRDWSIYVPAQYRRDQPASLMIFQDGAGFRREQGRWRVPVVFDNLIARGDMPPTIAVFINPGHDKSRPRRKNGKPSNRGYEYDSLGDRYARFLIEEILPEVKKHYNISDDPEMRAIGGSSSGAICAFTVAWERPDAFRKVYSNVGSFVNLRGGNAYPSLIRKTEPKPLRVYLADTSGDLDNAFGNWPIANQLMHSSLQYMGYDVRFDWADGYGHNADFGGKHFPDAMRWLWRNDRPERVLNTEDDLKGDLTLLELLTPGQSWEVVADELGFADAACSDKEGNFYFSDMRAEAVYRVSPEGSTAVELAKEGVSGLAVGPNGLLYACQGSKRRIVSIDPQSGEVRTVADGVTPNDLVVTSDGFIFATETKERRLIRIDLKTGERTVVETGVSAPNGIALSNDGGTLAISDHRGKHGWTFRVNGDGHLDAEMPTMTMRLPIDPEGEFRFNEPPPYKSGSGGDGMAVDRAGRYYTTSALGIQIFDPTGRQCGVLPKPDPSQPLTNCALAGADHDYLYVTNGTTVYRRKLAVERPR